ncbi:MAG: hypothetical protein IPP38_10195 [Bacteroidetes bacterium]|nr:hypothetical protein [Bacteroidota bacterium]
MKWKFTIGGQFTGSCSRRLYLRKRFGRKYDLNFAVSSGITYYASCRWSAGNEEAFTIATATNNADRWCSQTQFTTNVLRVVRHCFPSSIKTVLYGGTNITYDSTIDTGTPIPGSGLIPILLLCRCWSVQRFAECMQ